MTEHSELLKTRERQILWVAGFHAGTNVAGIRPGSFYCYLINAFFAADRGNLASLKKAFPITGEAYETYQRGELTEGE